MEINFQHVKCHATCRQMQNCLFWLLNESITHNKQAKLKSKKFSEIISESPFLVLTTHSK